MEVSFAHTPTGMKYAFKDYYLFIIRVNENIENLFSIFKTNKEHIEIELLEVTMTLEGIF